jgi:hypothetical protein
MANTSFNNLDENNDFKYLNLAGLSTFWNKAKQYVDDQDQILYGKLKDKIDEANGAADDRINNLSINGKYFDKNNNDVINLQSADIKVDAEDSDHAYAGETINTALASIAQILGGNAEDIADLKGRIEALSSATRFLGIATSALSDGLESDSVNIIDGDTTTTIQPILDGDVVIAMNDDDSNSVSCEFIYSSGRWYKLGDTTAESNRITKIENWIENNAISEAEIDEFDWAGIAFS